MISVIIPVYNAEQFLRQCMESVCKQSNPDLEIIAINDGSTDGSLAILKEYEKQDPRVRVISTVNKGISQARNTGIDEANGEWIAFVDSDDWLDLNALHLAYKAACEDKADIVMWSYIREYPSGPKPLQVFGSERRRYIADPLLYPYRRIIGPINEELSEPQKLNSCVTVWGKLYRRKTIGMHRMVDIQQIGSEDTLFNAEVFAEATIVSYLPDCLYHYRKENSQSFTHQDHARILNQFSELYQRIKQQIDNQDARLTEALQNRICLGVISLGMRFSRHKGKSFLEKRQVLQDALTSNEYQGALRNMKFQYLPLHWKVFFFCARWRLSGCLLIMIRFVDYLRKTL